MPHSEDKWELPEALKITNPDVLARADAMQSELALRVNSPFGHLNPQEQERANAAVMIEHLKGDLERVKTQLTDTDGATPKQELEDAVHQISARLAEAYASLGRFDLAAEIEPREETRAEYVEILEAINRPDDEWCGCAPGRDFVLRNVFSLKHGRVMFARKCGGCKTVNVTSLPPHLANERAHRAQARGLVGEKTPDEAKAILTAQRHTTAQLIRK